jgi:hypothetical protein
MSPLEDDSRMIDGEEMTAEMRILDAQLVEALERHPRVTVPEGFALRVALQASALRTHATVRATRFGVIAIAICTVLSAVAMVLLAVRTTGHDPFWTALQWMLCAQFCALTAWLGQSRQGSE